MYVTPLWLKMGMPTDPAAAIAEADDAAQVLVSEARLSGKQRDAQEELVGHRRDGGAVARIGDPKQVSPGSCDVAQFRAEHPHDAHLHLVPVAIDEAGGTIDADEQCIPGRRDRIRLRCRHACLDLRLGHDAESLDNTVDVRLGERRAQGLGHVPRCPLKGDLRHRPATRLSAGV